MTFVRKSGILSSQGRGAATAPLHMIPPHTKAIPQTKSPSGVPQAPEGDFGFYTGLYRAVNAVYRDFAGEDMLLAGVGADNKAALFVDIHGFAAALAAAGQVKGHAAADVDAGLFVLLPERREAIPREDVHGAVKAEIRQGLGQPLGVGGQIDICPLQRQRGAVGRSAASK